MGGHGPLLSTPTDFSGFPWMRHAYGELGQREIPGHGSEQDNPRILAYFSGLAFKAEHDETAWCSAFVNWVMGRAGIEGSGKPNARSWLSWGNQLPDHAPMYGAVTILWRGTRNGWQGHVGLYVGEEGNHLVLLGGNQGNSVTLKNYPKERLLGYRWPVGYSREIVCR